MVHVECYAGYKADERPLRFRIGDREFAVEQVLDRWTAPEADGFRVRTASGIYVLERNRTDGTWTATVWKRTY
jgi:hypothetical protein